MRRSKKNLKTCWKNFLKTTDIVVNYTDFARVVGFNYWNRKKPYYLMQNAYVIVHDRTGQKYYLKMNKGFVSDGCTIPRFLWTIFACPHTPEYLPASLIHDWLLCHPQAINRDRKLSSRIFRQLLIKEGVSKSKAQLMYWIVDIVQWLRNFKTGKWR